VKIEHFRQPTDHYCVPACLKMVLDYMCKHFNVKCKPLSIKIIAKATKTNKDGTAPRDAENINALLHRAKPPIKFRLFEMSKFPEIVKELNEEHPAIAWINIADEPSDTIWHAVAIVDFNPENNMVTYDDPDENEKDCIKSLEAGVFTKKWGFQARLIKVLIGTKGQTLIDGDWVPEGVSE
jgi:hypothetical protein